MAMVGGNIRGSVTGNYTTYRGREFHCHPRGHSEAMVIFSLGSLGMAANIALMTIILGRRQLRRWSQGLLFHQAMVDCARAAILIPLGISILKCQPVNKCSLVETAFLLLVTVSTVNMLTTVLNDSPVFPEDDEDGEANNVPLLMDSPQCVLFGTFMIWFASITINLGPTFLSGALAANSETNHNAPSCPLVHGPFRHYVLNVLWIVINLICVVLTLFHLHKLHRDLTKANVEAVRVAGLVTTLVSVTGGGIPGTGGMSGTGTPSRNGSGGMMGNGSGGAVEEHRRMRNYLRRMEREGVQRVKMFLVITAAYCIFWGPLFFVTLVRHPVLGSPRGFEITLHVAYGHAIVNPTLFLVLHRGLRAAVVDLCCGCCTQWYEWFPSASERRAACSNGVDSDAYDAASMLPPPPQPPVVTSVSDISLLKPPLPPLQTVPAMMQQQNTAQLMQNPMIQTNQMMQPNNAMMTANAAMLQSNPMMNTNNTMMQPNPMMNTNNPMMQANPMMQSYDANAMMQNTQMMASNPMLQANNQMLHNNTMMNSYPMMNNEMMQANNAMMQNNAMMNPNAMMQANNALMQSNQLMNASVMQQNQLMQQNSIMQQNAMMQANALHQSNPMLQASALHQSNPMLMQPNQIMQQSQMLQQNAIMQMHPLGNEHLMFGDDPWGPGAAASTATTTATATATATTTPTKAPQEPPLGVDVGVGRYSPTSSDVGTPPDSPRLQDGED